MIPYNPSSFNSNKTILEQILEIKKWLIAHPSYKVYYCTSNFMPTGDDDRAFTEIAGTEEEVQNIAVGDLLVFPDAYYSEVIAVDLDNEMVTIALPATNFSGPQGATGPSGADGANGTCIRYCNTNKNSNPSTTYAVSDITFSTGLQINDCILFKNNRIGFVDYISGGTFRVTQNIIIDGKDGKYVSNARIDENGDLIITLYDPESMIQSSIDVGHVVGADGNDGVSVTNVTIDGNSHLIVTLSDGSTIDAGSVSSGGTNPAVSIANYTTTLSDAEFNLLDSYDNSVIIYTGGTNPEYYYKGLTTSTNLIFYCIKKDIDNIWKRFSISVNKTTKGTSYGSTQLAVGSEYGIECGSATIGQVLGVVASGKTGWVNASGGSFDNYVTIIGVTGTFSDSDYNKLLQNDSVIINSDNKRIYAKYSEDTTTIVYENYYIYQNSFRRSYITITKSTKTWTHNNSYPTISTNNFYSGTATNGQVLTADGIGGASWQNASGGSTLYQHNIKITGSSFEVCFCIINNNSNSYSIISEIKTWLYNHQFDMDTRNMLASGVYVDNSKSYSIIGTYGSSGQALFFRCIDLSATSLTAANFYTTSGTISDKVITL